MDHALCVDRNCDHALCVEHDYGDYEYLYVEHDYGDYECLYVEHDVPDGDLDGSNACDEASFYCDVDYDGTYLGNDVLIGCVDGDYFDVHDEDHQRMLSQRLA